MVVAMGGSFRRLHTRVNLARLALVLAAPTVVFRALSSLDDEPRGSFISS
jgi:hypothetical protein